MMVAAFPTFEELLKKVKQPDLPDLKPPQTEFDTEGASQFGYKLPAGWKLKRVQGQGDVLLSPRGQSYRDIKTDSDGSISDFKAFDANNNPINFSPPSDLPQPPTEPPINPIEQDMEGPGIDIGLQPNEELFFDPQQGRMVRRIKPPPPLSPFQNVARAAQASQEVVKGLGQLGLQAAKGAQDVFAPTRAFLRGRFPTREEQEQAGRVLAASGQTGQDIAKSLVTFKPGETGLPPEVEAAMLLPGTGLTMGVGKAARLAATTARGVVPSAVARGLEVAKPILADERGGIRLPRKLPKEEAAFAAQEAAKGVGAAGKGEKGKLPPVSGLTANDLKIKAALEVMTPEDRTAYYNTLAGQKDEISQMLGEHQAESEAIREEMATAPLATWRGKRGKQTIGLTDVLRNGEWPETVTRNEAKMLLRGKVLRPGTVNKQGRVSWAYLIDELADSFGLTEQQFINQLESLKELQVKAGDFVSLTNIGNERLAQIDKMMKLAKETGGKDYTYGPIPESLQPARPYVPEGMTPGASVQTGMGIGEKPQNVQMLGEFKDIGKKQTLIDAEALKAKMAAKPLPGQAPLEAAPAMPKPAEAVAPITGAAPPLWGYELQDASGKVVALSRAEYETKVLPFMPKTEKSYQGPRREAFRKLGLDPESVRIYGLPEQPFPMPKAAEAVAPRISAAEIARTPIAPAEAGIVAKPAPFRTFLREVQAVENNPTRATQRIMQAYDDKVISLDEMSEMVAEYNPKMAERFQNFTTDADVTEFLNYWRGRPDVKGIRPPEVTPAEAVSPGAESAAAITRPETGVSAGQAGAPQGLTSGLPVQETTAENLQRLGENQRRANQGLPPVEAPIAPPSPTMPKPTEAVPPGVVGQAAPLPPSGKLADLIPEGRDNMTLRQAYQSAKAKGMVKTEAEFKTLLDSEIQAGTIGGGGGTSSKSPLNSRLGSGNITGYIERPKPEPIPPTKVAPGEAAITPPVGPVPPVKQATTRMKTIQAKGLNAPESVTPQEAKQAHIEMGAPDGPQPPKPPAKGRKRPAPDEPANILRQIAEKATSGERADQTLLRLHEGAITAETGRVGVIVRDGEAKLKALGTGVYRRGQLVPRSNDIPQLDDLYNALHNPSKVASGELQIPKGYEAIYKELRELTDWESVARLDFDPNMATVQDYFYRGWKPPEGMFANVAQGRPIVKTPAFKKPRVDATYQEMREAGFEPLFWNPYQQWGLSRMQGVKYREQMELVDKLKGMGDELIRPHAGGPIPQGWRVPEVGPAFEGKPFATTNPVTGEPMTMFTRRWITPDAVANMMENIYGKPPSVGKLIVGGKAFNPLAVIDWLTFIPKRAKLFGSFFQQIDFLNRNGAGAWSMLVDSLQAGKPVQGVMALARYPVNAVNILRANFSPAYRQSLARQLSSTTPLIKGRQGVNLKGISEAGLSTIDPTMLQWNQMDKVVQAVARETGVFKRLSSLVGDIESSMRRGLFSGVYPAAMLTDIKHYTAPMAARMYPKLNDAQLNGQIARLINKKYSTLPASQSVIQNQVLRETLRRVFFSMGETEGLLRQATGVIRGPEAAYWRKNYIGTYLFLIATASTIHFASTGKTLPKERYVPVSKDNWGPLPFSYNTKFASPTIPLKGREGAEVTLDVVGQMDTALRILDPGSFITARESTPIRALVNQISGTNFGGVSIDDVGPGGVLSRTAQLAQDLFAPIGAGPLAAEAIRENIPGAKELVAPQEARLGLTGLGVQATGINVRAANINDFIVDMAKIKGLPEREGQTPWDGTFEGLNPKEVAKLRRLPEAKAYAEALGETPANIERRVDERDFKAQEERSSYLGEWTGTGWSNGQRPDPANPGKMIPYTITEWKDDLSKLYTKKAIEAATRERIQGEFKRRKPKDEKEKARWGYYEIADKYTEKDKKGKPIPGGKIQDMEGFMQEQDEYLAGLSPELEKHVIDNLGVGDDPKATQFRIDKREIRKSYWKPLKDIEDPRSEDKLNEAQTLRIKGKIKEAESIEKVYHLAGYTMFKNDREDLLRRQNPQLDELLVRWGYGGSFKNPLNIDRQLGLDYPDKEELSKLYSAYYALPATSYLAMSQAQVDAGRLPEKYKKEWELYRNLKTDTAKGLFRKAHKEASNSDLQEDFRRTHPDFDEWLQQAKGLNPLKAKKAKKAPRIRSSVSLGSAGMRGFGGGVSKTSARKYPRFKKARVSRAMTIRAPR